MIKTRYTINALALFVFSLTLTALAQAQIGVIGDGSNMYVGLDQTFVKPTGADANPCTRLSPCKTFGAAMSRTVAGGEVIAMESGVYDPFTITKAITIVAPPGVHASVVSESDAITVNADPDEVVVLRNLNLKNSGGIVNNGIIFNSGEALSVEGFVISGFYRGIFFQPTARLSVSDTTVRGAGINQGLGILVLGTVPGTSKVTIERSRVERTRHGILAAGDVTVRNCVVTGNEVGIASGAYQPGIIARVGVEHCAVTHNQTGIRVGGTGVLWVAHSTVSFNDLGFGGTASQIFSHHNTIQWNQVLGTSPTVVN